MRRSARQKYKRVTAGRIRDPEEARRDEVFEVHAKIREMIKHEDQLIAGRIGRMLTAQVFLFTAIVFSDKPFLTDTVVPVIGIGLAIYSLLGLVHASNALDRLSDWWDVNYPDQKYLPHVKGYHHKNNFIRIALSETMLAAILLMCWVSILAYENAEKFGFFQVPAPNVQQQHVPSENPASIAEPKSSEAGGE